MDKLIDISAIKNGEETAFVEMYHLLNGRVYNFFLKKTRDPETSKDLTQQCFIRIYRYRASFSLDHPIEKQVYIIAKSIVLNYMRQEDRKKSREHRYIKEQLAGGTMVDSTDNTRFETHDYLDHLTVELPPIRKKVILLKGRLGLSNKEIAETLSISVKTVENHITKAHRHLRLHSTDLLLLIVLLSCYGETIQY